MDSENLLQESQKLDADKSQNLDITLGAALLVEVFGLNKRFRSTFIGMERDRYLIARLPQNIDRQYIRQDMELTIRYLHEAGKVFGFRSKVLYLGPRHFSLMFLSYPKSYEVLSLRKHERVDCLLPASLILDGDELSGVIVNISAGGLKFILDTQEYKLEGIKRDTQVVCKFNLFFEEKETVSQGLVRNVENDGHKLALGVQFDATTADIEKSIKNYVTTVKEFFD